MWFSKFIKEDVHFCQYYDDIFILLKTGLRISELCGLTKSDIDFQEQTINVSVSVGKKFTYSVKKYNSIYKVELSNITPHICRHTYCTNQVKRGLGVKTVQYLMGHEDVQTTLNIYTYVRLEDAKDDLEWTEIREQLKRKWL